MTRAYQINEDFRNGLVWFRRDLRTGDNAALYYALKHCERVWCVFVFDTTILQPLIDSAHQHDAHGGKVQDRRIEFILASVEELDGSLKEGGGGLIVLHGDPVDSTTATGRKAESGGRRGKRGKKGGKPEEVFHFEDVCQDVAAARDWANRQPFVQHGKIATWGFGWGGTAAFLSASLAGLAGAVAFYGQSIARPLPGASKAAIEEVDDVRAPLLLVFGGHDEQIGEHDIQTIRDHLTARGKSFEIEVYPDVGHSFFREDLDTVAARQIADAWDRVNAFLHRAFA